MNAIPRTHDRSATAKHAAGKNATAGVIGLESYQTQLVRSNSTGFDVHQSMVSPTPPGVGTEGAFGWELTTRIFAPGVGDLTDYQACRLVGRRGGSGKQ